MADPLEQAPSVALVMKPIREPAVFASVLECRDPSMVRAHSVVPKPPANLIAGKVPLRVWLVEESLAAVAVLVVAARRAIAASNEVRMRMDLMFTYSVGRCDQTQIVKARRRCGTSAAPS